VAIARGLRLEREDAGAWVHTSSTGALVYLPGGHAGAHRRLVVVDRQGALTPLSDEHRLPFVPPIFASPDRRRFAVAVMRENWLFAIFASEIDRPRLRLLGQGQDVDCDHPVWLPDSELLIYGCEGQTLAAGVYVAPVHGGAPKRIVAGVPGSQFRPTSVSPDGRWLLLQRDAQRSSIDLVRLDVKDREISASPGKPLLESDAPYGSGYFSTDGRWIVYASEESGRLEIFVRAFSHDGAVGPATLVGPSRNGSLLWLDPENGSQSLGFESEPGRWFSVNVTGTAVAELSNPRPAYDLSRIRPEVVPGSALPGGRLLAIQRAEEEAGARQIQLVLNISEELDRLVPVHP
jgi:Tol biopolymer transport system component